MHSPSDTQFSLKMFFFLFTWSRVFFFNETDDAVATASGLSLPRRQIDRHRGETQRVRQQRQNIIRHAEEAPVGTSAH